MAEGTPTAASAVPHRFDRLRLRDELYLVAHDDTTARLLINQQVLEIGLAGAVLIDLWLAQRVAVGWVAGPGRRWVAQPGALSVYGREPVDDLGTVALTVIRQTAAAYPPQDQLRQWLRGFAGIDLYVRVQAAMTVAGILRREPHRGRHRHVPREPGWPVRARAMVCAAADKRAEPDPAGPGPVDAQLGALCGLIEALQLTEFLYHPNLGGRALTRWLRQIVAEQHPDVQQMVAAVDNGRGDLAVAAMR